MSLVVVYVKSWEQSLKTKNYQNTIIIVCLKEDTVVLEIRVDFRTSTTLLLSELRMTTGDITKQNNNTNKNKEMYLYFYYHNVTNCNKNKIMGKGCLEFNNIEQHMLYLTKYKQFFNKHLKQKCCYSVDTSH